MDKTFQSGELDFAYDDEHLATTCARLAKRFGVYVKIEVLSGPGGGWPVVRLVGALTDVARCVQECWMSGDNDQDTEVFALALAEGEYIS